MSCRRPFLFLLGLPICAAVQQPIRVTGGLVSGASGLNPAITVFRGIPYAAPPIGTLRWKAPQAAPKWEGVRAATEFAGNCMQNDAAWYPPNNGTRPARSITEDCLYLNVYTGAKSASDRRPVLLFVHGGGLTFSAGTYYDGEPIAEKGVVVVTFNYRLGVFGFLAHPELTTESGHHASGNYGFMDQIAAMHWVKDNIAAFGGDPNNVTLAGQSAGSWSVNLLLGSPLTKGLFKQAFGESGGQFALGRSLADAEKAGLQFAKNLGADSIADLRAKPAADLQKAGRGAAGWNIDGYVIPADIAEIYAKGQQVDVPLMIGSTGGEATSPRMPNVTADSFRKSIADEFGPLSDAVLKAYPFSNDQEAKLQNLELHRDQTFGWPTRAWMRAQAATGKSKVYGFYFERVAPGPYLDAGLGAPHGAGLAYFFNWVNSKANEGTAWRDSDSKLADQVSSYWVNFATKGDPNGSGLPQWPIYDPKTEVVMRINETPSAGTLPHIAALDVINAHFERLRKEGVSEPRRRAAN